MHPMNWDISTNLRSAQLQWLCHHLCDFSRSQLNVANGELQNWAHAKNAKLPSLAMSKNTYPYHTIGTWFLLGEQPVQLSCWLLAKEISNGSCFLRFYVARRREAWKASCRTYIWRCLKTKGHQGPWIGCFLIKCFHVFSCLFLKIHNVNGNQWIWGGVSSFVKSALWLPTASHWDFRCGPGNGCQHPWHQRWRGKICGGGGDNGGVMHIYEVLLLSPGLGMLEHRNSVGATFVPKKGRASLWMMSKRGRRLIDTMMWPLFWVIRDEILLWSSLSRLVICSKDSHQWIWGKRSKNGFGGGLAGWCFSVFVSHPPWDPKLSSDWTGTEGIAKKGSETYPDVFCFF